VCRRVGLERVGDRVRRAQQVREVELDAIDQREARLLGAGHWQLGLPQEELLAVVGAVGSVDRSGIVAALGVAYKLDGGEAARGRCDAVLLEERVATEPERKGVLGTDGFVVFVRLCTRGTLECLKALGSLGCRLVP